MDELPPQTWSAIVSWIAVTALLVFAAFAAFFALGEWMARRRAGGGDDPSVT